MRRIVILVATVGLIMAAAPSELPVPPIPPQQGPGNQTAPVPDEQAEQPDARSSATTRFRLKDYKVNRFDLSAGFMPGSHYQTSEERKPIQTPGFSVTVPIH